MNLTKARQIIKAHDEELRQLDEDWFSGGIPTVADYNRHRECLRVIYPDYQAAVAKVHVHKSELAMKRQRKAQARFGT